MTQHVQLCLDDHSKGVIDALLAAGRYASASEVIRAGLRLLEEHEAKVRALDDAVTEGDASGPPQSFDIEAFLTRMHERIAGR